MTMIAWPAGFVPSSLRFTQSTKNLSFTSAFSGATYPRSLAPAMWVASITMPPKQHNREFIAFLMKLRGGLNTFSLYDFTRPVPKGTMRGTMTLAADVDPSDDSVSIDAGVGQANKTLVAGDWLSFGGQLFMVSADAQANGSGVITVSIEPPARAASLTGASVIWDKPTAEYRVTSADNGFDVLNAGYVGGISIDAMEKI